MPAPGEAAVVRERLRESHADSGSERGSQSHQKSGMRGMRGKSSGKNGSERGDRSVHQTGQSRLYHLEEEKLFLRFFLTSPRTFFQRRLGQLLGLVLVRAFLLRQIVQT